MITLKRNVTRETNLIDYRTRKPIVIQLVEGGDIVRIKAKGARTWYSVTYQQIWVLGAQNRAAEIRAERKAKKKAMAA
jgi:hypothetical protein